MERHSSEIRVPASTAGKYFERLTKALPGSRTWSGSKGREFWPEGAKLAISLSLQILGPPEARRTAENPSAAQPGGETWLTDDDHEYGPKEGIPRLLDIFQRRRVRVTSHIAGSAIDLHPHLAHDVVEHGHEVAIHSELQTRDSLTPMQERSLCEAEVRRISRATGVRPVGFQGIGSGVKKRMVKVLQELEFLYHVDDASRDEPFLLSVDGRPFVVIPSTPMLNDLLAYENWHQTTDQYACELKNEFEMLYTEAEHRRRMMSISAHDYVAGRPARAKVLEEFIIHAQRRPGVVFLRKDDIARFALASPVTPKDEETSDELEAA